MFFRVFLTICLSVLSSFSKPIVLNWPLACNINENCFIQQYMDIDESEGILDFSGGAITYNGHKGTDIRLTTLKAMNKGVNVLSSAKGKVIGIRNNISDKFIRTNQDRVNLKGKDCGNGVLVSHRNGWETQYCHMKKGSIVVKMGQMVSAGEILGEVGLSGLTQFPHLHISIRKDGKKVDPFSLGANLWNKKLKDKLIYQATQIINLGFSDIALTMTQIESGVFQDFIPSSSSSSLLAYVRVINLRKGDRVRLIFTMSNEKIISKTFKLIKRNKAQQMYFIGKRRPSSGWNKGLIKVEVQVIRKGIILVKKNYEKKL